MKYKNLFIKLEIYLCFKVKGLDDLKIVEGKIKIIYNRFRICAR
jgi:hypothetical protein